MANYIKFRHNEALLVKLKIKRLSAAFFLLHKVPEQVIEESQRDPAAFLFAIRRLFLNRNRQELQFSLLRINQKARKTAHLGYLQTEVMLKMTLSTKTILSLGKVIARNQQYQLKSSLDEIALHSARKLHDTKMFCQRIYLGLRTLTSTLANLKQKTNRQTFSACFRTIQEHQKTSLSSTVKSLTQQLEAAREETRSSESMVLALKAEFSKIRAEQTSTMLDYQKAMAKVKVLEGENLSLVTRINADVEGREKESKVLQASIEKANRDLEKSVREKEKAVTEVQKARAECETLKSQLKEALTLAEERIGESQNQADFRLLKVLSEKQELENIVEKLTVESARAAAGRAELADKLAEVFRQREQEKNWISQKEQDNKALSATVLTLEAQLKEALKQNNLYKEKLADTTNDLTLIKSELQKRSKETSDTINSLSKEVNFSL
jgi:chromosome segregation ATPase